MKQKKLKIVIGENGKVSLQVIGAQGKECLEWTKGLESILGTESHPVSRQMKASYYEENFTSESIEEKKFGYSN